MRLRGHMRQSRLEILVGAFVLAFVAFVLFALKDMHSLWNTEGTYTIRAQFNSIEGVNVGSPVYIHGVKVGKVSKVTLDSKTYGVMLDMQLKPTILVPTDSTASIVSESLIGGKQLSILPGGSADTIKPDGVISFTQSPMNMETLLIKAFVEGKDKK
jgi:phospholipid/cholesterol/gamma-HCH transport system substrate-binding protein